ncbi:MAG TPA: biotin--[acetyl-CoA-carboxylase] ligase [Gemmatimonadaceae bacterium]|nr:biotin--[acetyl-CoA-carboxylase] ligase [Gemmatimonadaceae bacterium]
MPSSADAAAPAFDGASAELLAASLGVPRVELFASVTSTLDVAHAIAATAPSGTLVVADEQRAGRGTHGRRWTSPPGTGLWLTLVERPSDAHAVDVLSLRCGLLAAEALEPLARAPVGLKWPNDLYVGGRKLAGVLIETRWRGATPEWVAIGVGLNVVAPPIESAAGLAPGATRLGALARLVPALRRAAACVGQLGGDELARWRARDVARGRVAVTPSAGRVEGISAGGELLVRAADGTLAAHRAGSLTFAEPLPCS